MPVIVSCPSCEKALQVPEEFFGRMVQCPECKTMFQAAPKEEDEAPASQPASKPTDRQAAFEPSAREGGASSSRRQRPDDDFGEREIRRRRESSIPDRGGLILTLGIVSLAGGVLLCLPAFVGPAAWLMGNHDLAEMRAGRMNPAGQSNTETGRVLGMIATLLLAFSMAIFCGLVGLVFLAAGAP